jgi:hypothetical protein
MAAAHAQSPRGDVPTGALAGRGGSARALARPPVNVSIGYNKSCAAAGRFFGRFRAPREHLRRNGWQIRQFNTPQMRLRRVECG